MFRADEQLSLVPRRGLVQFGATTALVAMQLFVPLTAIAEDGPGYRPPATERAPNGAPAPPDAGQQPRGEEGGGAGNEGRDGARQPDSTPGCPYRDRPLNLLV